MFGETRWEKHEENEETVEARQLFLGRAARSRVLPMIIISRIVTRGIPPNVKDEPRHELARFLALQES